MTTALKQAPWTRLIALGLVFLFALPLIAGCGSKGDQTASAPADTSTPPGPSAAPANTASAPMNTAPAPKQGMSNTKKAVIVLAGAALLYYLYKKHQAQQQAQGANGSPQLYRSSNGGIYYRDAQHRAVWVTAPAQQMQVPAAEVQQYAPDYNQYQGQPAPAAPAGYRTQSFSQLDPGLATSGNPPGPGR